MIKVGILGAAGYTGGELIRLLLNHPEAEIVFANSESNAGNLVSDVHEGLIGDTDLRFTDGMPFEDVDVLFFCFGHGKSQQFLKEHTIPEHVKIIDLAQDFRLSPPQPPQGGVNPTALQSPPLGGAGGGRGAERGRGPGRGSWVYGLPELNREAIRQAQHVANPGCFATAIQLGLLPAAKMGLLTQDVSVNAITGSTGAGQKPGATTHFSWRTGNLSIYKAFTHQHLAEIYQSLRQAAPPKPPQGGVNPTALQSPPLGGAGGGRGAGGGFSLDFIPYRGDFARGIFCTEVIRTKAPADEVIQAYRDFYRDAAFTHYVDKPLDLKQVVNTNKCLIHIDAFDGKLLVTSVIDNLLKGAVGQAVQNMNMMFGLDETTGLRLKASAF